MEERLIAYHTQLPCTVPIGGIAVVLADGHIAPNGVQGPGQLKLKDWRQHGRHVEAVLFPARHILLRFDIDKLASAEGVSLSLRVNLSMHVERPVDFMIDVVQGAAKLTEAELIARFQDALRTALALPLGQRSLDEIFAEPDPRGWLGTIIHRYLCTDADLLSRSGLKFIGIDAYDLRCEVRDEGQCIQNTWYLRATVAQADAEGRRMVDEALLAQLRDHIPDKRVLVDLEEQLADLEEREAEIGARRGKARRARRAQTHAWLAELRTPPSTLRPELWRVSLGEEVRTAPLADKDRVYAVTRSGRASAFHRQDGEPAWPQSAELGTMPGDGLTLEAGMLWIPGHDGVLYGLDPHGGHIVHGLDLGGKLSSAPLASGSLLYQSIDVSGPGGRAGYGQVVSIDPGQGKIVRRYPVCKRGLRAQPAIWDWRLYIGDRSGEFHALDLRRGEVEVLPVDGGRILAPALVDKSGSNVIVADSYGQVQALDREGRQRWVTRVGGPVVGSTLLHRGVLYVGAGDGQVYSLNPADGLPARDPIRTGDTVAAAPAGWGDLVFVAAFLDTNRGYLYALDAGSGDVFWKYHSGGPVCVTPAVTQDGSIYVVDCFGNLSALRWCLARYPEAARRAQEARPPRWADAAELWTMSGDKEAAIEAAERANRPDMVAALALSLRWHQRAALAFEDMARLSRDPLGAALHWHDAAEAWRLQGSEDQASRCRLKDAQGRKAPLLSLDMANRPLTTIGQPAVVQMCVANLTETLAHDVVLSYQGDVQKAGRHELGALGPLAEHLVDIRVIPTESGSATLRTLIHYSDRNGRDQRPVPLEVELGVDRPPEVHKHYYGPHVGGDGVIIVRGQAKNGERQRHIQVQSGDDAIDLGRCGQRVCARCGEPLTAEQQYCTACGEMVE